MLKALLSYSAAAFVVQVLTGGLTFVTEMVIAGRLGREGLGRYGYFMLIMEMLAGPFIAGLDHALIIFINRRAGNDERFRRLYFTYVGIIVLGFVVAAAIVATQARLETWLAVAMAGPFVVVLLGMLVFRAGLDRRGEFGLLLMQSLIWSLGCLATIWIVTSDFVPIYWAIAAKCIAASFVVWSFARRQRREGRPLVCRRPFAEEYAPFWQSYRHLWMAGMAFVANAKAVEAIIAFFLDGEEGEASAGRGYTVLGGWVFVLSVMRFIEKPLQLIRRATLPLFSRQDEDVFGGFRSMVRMNLLVFPLLVIAVLTALPIGISLYDGLDDFSDAWTYLAIILVATPAKIVEFLVSTASMARGDPRRNRDGHVAIAFVNIPLAFLLIGAFGLFGAALSAALHVALFAVVMMWFVRRDLPQYIRFAIRPVLVSTACLCAAVGVQHWMGRTVAAGIVAVAIYLVSSWLLRLWRWQHVRFGWDALVSSREK